ncbi:hypothetical protein [Azospirillum sp. sgz302134]
MRLMGVLLIIWGFLLVPLTLPWTWGYIPQLGFIGSLDGMTLRVMGDGIPYAGVVTLSVMIVGLGVSWFVLGTDLDRIGRGRPTRRKGEE